MNLKTILARTKRKLFQKPFIADPRYPSYWFDQALGSQEAYLVQIGSNDGKTGDPLFPLLAKNQQWKALFVEPIPDFFAKLQANYPDHQRFRFENAAVNQGEELTFHWVDAQAKQAFPDLPYWYDQLGSFDKQHILNHFNGKLAPFIISRAVNGIRLPQLLERNRIDQIDVLHIDAEGYDWKILSQLDLSRYAPSFIMYEYHHLSPEELQAAEAFLREKYVHFRLGIDALAVHRHIDPKLLRGMRSRLLQKIK